MKRDESQGRARLAVAAAATALVAAHLALDVFACALDQVGLAEMKTAVEPTGGFMVLAETFASDNFRTSLGQLLARALGVHQQATAWVARIKLQHGTVVGLPVFQMAGHGHIHAAQCIACQISRTGLKGADGVVIHHHKRHVWV
jgi:hypothetical protein